MGLDVYLEDEFGEELDLFIDDGGILAAAIPAGDASFPMLRHVDVEGVTAFNRLQLSVVIPELERLETANASMNNTKAALSKVLKMARKAASEPHLYLSFLGD
jgi:hypothetical protein